ncbi:hypothetical protein QAD02_023097 [Eretmocerus hayati]|uniref:Uncharacterized protein n=1 Tax=Eretmocerus hayati TaxID=131215 RepID=A0ACC2PVZ5_9HYME|nr:hypothetical protein QAD02_023097 [Eretmocerus hayati]
MHGSPIQAENAPVILWLQGGPGDTSLFGLFAEHGPCSVSSNQTLEKRKYSWNINHNVIYIDSPVGTGYSFTNSDIAYARSVSDVAQGLYIALVQFFKLFPKFQKNDFYVAGESYGGKYVPAISSKITAENAKAQVKINLKGLSIGNGWSDPINQLDYGEYLYQIGLIDSNGKKEYETIETKTKDLIKNKNYIEADLVLTSATILFEKLTGSNFLFNYLQWSAAGSDNRGSFSEWVQRSDVRKAIHVGNSTFNSEARKVTAILVNDILDSVAHLVAENLEKYRVLIYNGQLDIICGYPMTVNYLRNLKWSGAENYKTVERKQWWVGDELAGYSKSVGNLTEVLVRAAGHAVPIDQPKWAWDLITRLTHYKKF